MSSDPVGRPDSAVEEPPIEAVSSVNESLADVAVVSPHPSPLPEGEGTEMAPPAPVAEEVDVAEDPHPSPLPKGEGINWHAAARDAVASATNLPPAVRAHVSRSLDHLPPALVDAAGRPLIPVAEAVAALAAAMPANWLADPAALQQASHPAGETFFDVSADGLSDERAAQIVRRQFESTGYLKAATQPAS